MLDLKLRSDVLRLIHLAEKESIFMYKLIALPYLVPKLPDMSMMDPEEESFFQNLDLKMGLGQSDMMPLFEIFLTGRFDSRIRALNTL